MRTYWLYILANKPRGTLYVGVTNDLIRRSHEHKSDSIKGFTKEYAVRNLVYFEQYDDVRSAIQREKNIKHWPRQWKLNLVNSMNPQWRDLTKDIAR